MRWPVLLALLLPLGGCGGAGPVSSPPPARPLRVMSLNQCTDQLVLTLLPPERIASVTWLSRDPRFSAQAEAARAVPVNRGGVEEVVRTAPDLVVTDTFSNPAGRALLRRIGMPMVEVSDAATVADIRRNVRQVAAAVGEVGRGEAMIAAMDRALSPGAGTPIRVAAWDRDGMRSGPMLAIVLAAAGLTQVGHGHGGVETLLATAPDRLIDLDEGARTPSLGDDRARNPIVTARWPRTKRFRVAQADLFRGTPAIGRAAVALRRQARGA